ncbi:hypothetical protein L1887_31291 [Cichorium endivia]|nr:hypothetical protein L1887_31291 [Cichorium endivia]
MAKFKLRIFQSCRSKDPSTLPEHPVPAFQRRNIFTVDFTPPNGPPHSKQQQQPHRSSFKSHVSSAFGCGSKSGDQSDSEYFQWQEDEQWHVVAKIYDVESPRRKIYNSSVSGGDTDDDRFPLPLLPLPPVEKKKRRRGRRAKINKLRNISTSSGDSGLFSSEYSIHEGGEVEPQGDGDGGGEDDETETLISSSRSFSTDSSTDFNPQLETIRECAPISLTHRYKLKKRTSSSKRNSRGHGGSGGGGGGGMMMMMCRGSSGMSPEWGSPARLSVFKKIIPCKVEGKMKESFAVVKRSEDPFEDFKRSMMEMIMEKQMFEETDLEQLLQCFLSLNSRFHHGVIVEAFSEIWDTMFGDDD